MGSFFIDWWYFLITFSMTDIDFSKYSGAQDLPDTRDFRSEELVGALPIITLPDRIILDQTPYLNQWSRGACTVFWSSGAWFETLSQIMTSINEKYTQPFDPWTVWDEALKRWASDANGWYIQSALQLLTDLWLIGGYVKIWDYGSADAYTMQYWINKWFGVVTGSAKGDWGAVVSTGRYSEQKGNAGHCFYQNGYDKNLDSKLHLHFPNSWNGTGDFWMDFDTYGKRLFTQYIIIETKDVSLLKEIKGKRRADALIKAREYKLWNEERPTDIASDQEITTMINRALGLSSEKTRAWYANLFQKKILQGKANLPIWNQKDWLKKATPLEVATMFTRSARRDSSAKSGIMIREDVAVIVARDLIA